MGESKTMVQRLDDFQRTHRIIGFPIAALYKYIEDQGNYLAALIAYYAFNAIFPILLILSSVLGFLLQGNADLQQSILEGALAQFPIIGDQLGAPEGLQGSTSAVVVGSIAAIYGSLGLGHAGQHLMYVAWAVPRVSRPNPILLRLRSLLLVSVAGFLILTLTTAITFAGNLNYLGIEFRGEFEFLIVLATVGATTLLLALLFWTAGGRIGRVRTMIPGALFFALLWQFLQYIGALYVSLVLARVSSLNATFALVLGMLGFLYLTAVTAVVGVEINVVRARKLYPRALLVLLTDKVELTDADRRAYRYYANSQRYKGFQSVEVDFDTGA